jgi:hypothetical protein
MPRNPPSPIRLQVNVGVKPPTTMEDGREAVRLRHLSPDMPRLGWTVLHVCLVAMMSWWAGVLMLPFDTFNGAGTAYSAFQAIWPDEKYWAVGFGIASLFGAWGLLTRKQWVRVSSTLWLGLNHGLIAILLARGNPIGTGQGMYAIIMLMAYALAAREAMRAN